MITLSENLALLQSSDGKGGAEEEFSSKLCQSQKWWVENMPGRIKYPLRLEGHKYMKVVILKKPQAVFKVAHCTHSMDSVSPVYSSF